MARRLTTNQEIAGSIPASVTKFLLLCQNVVLMANTLVRELCGELTTLGIPTLSKVLLHCGEEYTWPQMITESRAVRLAEVSRANKQHMLNFNFAFPPACATPGLLVAKDIMFRSFAVTTAPPPAFLRPRRHWNGPHLHILEAHFLVQLSVEF
ncbi:hypothetical protein N7541_004219 [Penicillium brevicompactum]|uniref:Uncharacterized protein n=1 Tax=Penicillium brevicompactum TaxID=5074 RepID=A0A9W9RPN8_PENBR|nr:hypothetical protein N7541_004219 [Penicillium brevicompactum]